MDVKITPSILAGEIRAVSSKSEAHRALIASALADSPTEILVYNNSEDIKATLSCLGAMGAGFVFNGNVIKVFPIKKGSDLNGITLDCKLSASTLRFLLPIAMAFGGIIDIRGESGLCKRPIEDLLYSLKGVGFSSEKLPLTMTGKLMSGDYTIRGDVSSQYISGLLFSLPLLDGDSTISILGEKVSASYIELTLKTLADFGIEIKRTERGFFIKGNQNYISPKNIEVGGDYSNASFFYLANYLGGDVKLDGLDENSLQGDRGAVTLFDMAKRGDSVIDIKNNPDLAPVLGVLGCFVNGKTEIVGAKRLRLKESDRILAITENINKMGGKAIATEDGFIVYGTKGLDGGVMVDGFLDHRIVMAFSIASCFAKKESIILGAEAINKSYPNFFNDVGKLGGKINVL